MGEQNEWYPHWPSEILRPAVSSEMGDHCLGIHKGDGLHQQSPSGCSKESTRANSGGRPKAQGQVSKEGWRCWRPKPKRGRPGLGQSRLGGYDYEAAEEGEKEETEVTWYTPFPCTDPLGSRSLLSAVNFLFRSVLRARCSFSYFVHVSLQRSRGVRSSTATALFPIPLPLDNAWDFGLQRLGKSRRERLAVRRMVHLAVMALNYLHFRQPLKCLPNMQRRPSALHLLVYARLSMLSRAGGPVHEVSVMGCGRKSFQLSARRFEELLGALQGLGLSSNSPYQCGREGTEVEMRNNREELIPYRPLCAERLKLTGQANWDPTPFLSDLFYMPFVEPRVNEFDILAPSHLRPDLSGVDKKEVEELCRVWDSRGLLEILPEELGCRDSRRMAKVFNNFKNALTDRQIGDRRAQNYAEGKLSGPSRDLPTAAALLQVAPTPSLTGGTSIISFR